ncbi:hypothetical protein L2E82_01133 [Cichorium intybus]|uniref:Uncharacterized protein n=1 Tax=Cichorium intybus TaxID=13427 RepID=A0ACB9GXZ4_CICIN|nr:hypothetical protein L2E82_01133 [Cichorium intybus]
MLNINSLLKHNSILKDELLSKKDALGDHHQALKQEVATLKESSIDEKTKADLEDKMFYMIKAKVKDKEKMRDN